MKFLINRTDAIGDLVLTLPLIPYIKEKYPKAEIALIVGPKNVELMEYAQLVDKYWVYDKKVNLITRLITLFKLMKEFKPDIYLFVGGSHFISFIAWLARIKKRGGLLSRLPSFLFLNKGIRQPRSLAVMHESEYNFNLLNNFGFKYIYKDKEKFFPRIEIPTKLEENVLDALKDKIKIKSFIVIHPGMSGHTLNWPIINYARLIRLIEEKMPDKYSFVVSYTGADLPIINQIKDYFLKPKYQEMKNKIYYYDGSIDGLGQFMALLKNAKYFIGPSTGPTHLASLLKVPLIALYSPIKTQSAMRWGPFYENKFNKIIVPEVICGEDRKCSLDNCPYHPCMSKIEVDEIIHNISDIL